MEKPDHILVVDEERDTRRLLRDYLTKHGFRVSTAADGREMRQMLALHTIDLIVLDLLLPGEDGLQLCRDQTMRRGPHIPILVLTSRDEEADRVIGLEMGADDYLVKPFAPRELLARIRAVLRRTRMLPPNLQSPETARFIDFDGWRLDTHARHLLDASGTLVSLTAAEYRLLRVFTDFPQRVLTREQLLSLTQGRDADPFNRSIDILISRLRHRLRDEARESRYIKTIRNEGYVFCGAVQARCL